MQVESGGNNTGENLQAVIAEDPVIAEDRKRCICGPCPSYNECMRAEGGLLFCITGKTGDCTFGMKGCSCPVCPVWKARSLRKAYCCIRGSAEEQV
ncbi:DUF2769 domain-containing protein [Methanoregula sp.]|uniref:DUF2769 domain-containing protein n=1 Tax=Methanoregula sp. TaxID=2052170 RepID=UPI003C74CDD7